MHIDIIFNKDGSVTITDLPVELLDLAFELDPTILGTKKSKEERYI